MKNTIITLLFVLAAMPLLHAQKQYLFLKNGSILKGKILFSVNPETVKLASSGNILVIKRSDIDSVAMKKKRYARARRTVGFKYFFRANLGILPGNSGNEQVAPAHFSASFNRQVYKTVSAGLGSGMEFYNETTFIPLYANMEYRFRDTRFSPVLFLKTGYLFATGDSVTTDNNYPVMPTNYIYPPNYGVRKLDPHGGFMINPGIGMNILVSDDFGFYLGFGYRYHRIAFNGADDYSLMYNYNRLSIDIGIIFK